MAIMDDTPERRRGMDPAKVGGFLAGIAITLVLGLMASIMYSGQGIGDVHTPPPQVYTSF